MFEARPVQTKVKHKILEEYVKAWGGIIVNGARVSIDRARKGGYSGVGLHFIYVDCFAGDGRYIGEQEDQERGMTLTPVFGSPIIGVRALDSLVEYGRKENVPVRVSAILIESGKTGFPELKDSLVDAGLGQRIRETDDFDRLLDGEIALVYADSTNLVDKLLAYTTMSGKYVYAFYLLDPYGPMGIPLANVGRIISQDHHDTLINMPYQDLLKKSGIIRKAQPSQTETTLLRNYDAMFGSDRWRQIVEDWQQAELDSRRNLELDLANHYRDVLQNIDPTLSVKSLPLRFSDKERTMYHLYLTTHDPNGAIRMNGIVQDAGFTEHHLRWQLKYARMTRGGQQLGLFAPNELAPPTKQSDRNDYVDEIAAKIVQSFSGKVPNRRQIYQLLADELYLKQEIDRALTQLKKSGKASFDGPVSKLKNTSPIHVN